MRPVRHRLRRLTKLLDLMIRESIRISEDKNRRGPHRAAGLLPNCDRGRSVWWRRTAAEQLLAIEVRAAGELDHCSRRRSLPQSRGEHLGARWRVPGHENQAVSA